MVVIADTSSLSRLVQYYLPFDREGILLPLLETEIKSKNLIIIDKVLQECQLQAKGTIVKAIPFLKNSKVYDTSNLPTTKKFMNLIENNFIVRGKYNKLKPEEKEHQKEAYIKGADFALLLCAYINVMEIGNSLFHDNVAIMTEESESQNDGKFFKKIPLCCKLLSPEVKTITIAEYLKDLTCNDLHFEI